MQLYTTFLNRKFEIKIWNGETLNKVIVLDTETTVADFNTTPDLVTFQAYDGGDCVYYVRRADVSQFLQDHSLSSFVMHNAAFDVDVMCKFLDNRDLFNTYYDNNKIYDTGILYRLVKLASQGWVPMRYSLDLITKELFNFELNKDEKDRKFILIEKADFIKDITLERIKRSLDLYNSDESFIYCEYR